MTKGRIHESFDWRKTESDEDELTEREPKAGSLDKRVKSAFAWKYTEPTEVIVTFIQKDLPPILEELGFPSYVDIDALLEQTPQAIQNLSWHQKTNERIFHATDTEVTDMHDEYQPAELVLAIWIQSIDSRHQFDFYSVNFGEQDVIASKGRIRILNGKLGGKEERALIERLYGVNQGTLETHYNKQLPKKSDS